MATFIRHARGSFLGVIQPFGFDRTEISGSVIRLDRVGCFWSAIVDIGNSAFCGSPDQYLGDDFFSQVHSDALDQLSLHLNAEKIGGQVLAPRRARSSATQPAK